MKEKKVKKLMNKIINITTYEQPKQNFSFVLAVLVSLFAIILFLFSTSVTLAATTLGITNSNVVSSGLVGHWTFDGNKMTNTTALNSLPGGVSGSLAYMTSKSGAVIGKIGQALKFDGVDDYINFGGHTTEQTTYTVSFWVNKTSSSGGTLLHRGDSYYCFYNPRIEISATHVWASESGCSGGGNIGSVAISNGWHHLVLTRSGQTVRFYVDSVLMITDNSQTSPDDTTSFGRLTVGAVFQRTSSYSGYLNSTVDDLRIYNRALSLSEVKQLYQLSVPSKFSTFEVKTIYITSGTTFSAPADWPGIADSIEVIGGGASGGSTWYGSAYANGGGGGAYAKKSNVVLSNGNTLKVGGTGQDTYVCNATSNCSSILGTSVVVGAKGASGTTGGSGASSVGDVTYSGGSGGAVYQSGAGGGGAGGPNGAGKNGGSGWNYFPNPYPGGGGGGGAGGGSSTNGSDASHSTSVGAQGGTAQDGTSGGTQGVAGSHGSGGGGGAGGGNGAGAAGGRGTEWDSTHGAGGGGGGGGAAGSSQFAGVGGNGGLYGGGGGAAGSDSKPGSSLSGGTGGQGLIVIKYTKYNTVTTNSTLVSTPIQSNLVGHWTFDGKNMTNATATDSSIYGNNGTLTNMTTNSSAVIGKIGQALRFDGVDDFINISGTASQSNVQNLTFSAWVYLDTTFNSSSPGAMTIFGKYEDDNNRAGLYFSKDGGYEGKLANLIVDGGVVYRVYTQQSSWAPGWYYLTMQTGTGGLKIYVNGVSAPLTVVLDTTLGWSAVGNNLMTIGNGYYSTFGYYTPLKGRIDDVRLYNRALSASEIQGLYKLGAR